MKALGLINGTLEFQLPFIAPFKKWLVNLQLGNVPKAKSELIIEAVAEIREGLLERYVSSVSCNLISIHHLITAGTRQASQQ